MSFTLKFTEQGDSDLGELEKARSKQGILKAVQKCLGYLEVNPKHPSLKTHKFNSLTGPNGEDVFEAYAQNNTPGAYRVFSCYGPAAKEITIIAITPHP
tara:strand:+ start:26181 stop:26477 length:297 start_codon:yes stop_codon:yes gene_type:complete